MNTTQICFWWNPSKQEVIQTCCVHMMAYMTHQKMQGQAPKLNIIDKEASEVLKLLLQKNKTVVQLGPPHSHRINAAEHAIHKYVNHFV